MKRKYYILSFTLAILLAQYSNAQSIRKNFLEMTDYEKTELVNAFYLLRNGPDLFNDLATFHGDFFNFDNTATPDALDLHFNLPGEPEREIFLGWHRRQMFEMEQAVQNINPEISLVYWDSSVDQSTTGPLWDADLLGPFNADWSLNRNLGGNGPMPVPADIADLMAETDFFLFSNELERDAVHRGAHVWTGGAMPTPLSPRDPVFYFHHSHVDKIWHDWEEIHQSSAFLATSMLRYDGTYVYDGQTLPLVDPNDITDTRVLGVFYAENGLAQLDNYIVSNTYNAEEVFYYQFNIEAGNNFLAPAGTSSRFESVNEINLTPGFEAAPGASFEAIIDTQNGAASKSQQIRVSKPYPFSEDLFKPVVWNEGDDMINDKPVIITAHPNPFTEKITINLSTRTDCVIEVFNMMGMKIREEAFQNTDNLVIKNLYGLSAGFYVIRVTDGKGDLLVVKRVIKL
nr:tyrosinase family protein [uncultured Allomuricauda sp.]